MIEEVLRVVFFAPVPAMEDEVRPTVTAFWDTGGQHFYSISAEEMPRKQDFMKTKGKSSWLDREAWTLAIAELLIEGLSQRIDPYIASRKKELLALVEPLEERAEEARAVFDFLGEDFHLTRKGSVPRKRWKWAGVGLDSIRGWKEDRAPLNGEFVWVLRTSRQFDIRLAKVKYRPDYGDKNGLWVFELLDFGPARFNRRGDLLVPEGPVSSHGEMEGSVIARSRSTDALAGALSMALHRLSTERDRKAVITAAFGDILKPLVDRALELSADPAEE